MKTKKYITLLAAVLFSTMLTVPQDTAAKKIEYLGHTYNGKVNKQKIPEGLGELTVKGLTIEGTFADRTVTDAIVKIKDGTPLNNTFNGTITYDESDKIRLKAGGSFTRWYIGKNCNQTSFRISQSGIPIQNQYSYNKNNEIQKSTETLTRDIVVDADGFIDFGLKIPQGDFSKEIANLLRIMKYDIQKLDIPEGLPYYLQAQMKEVYLEVGGNRYKKQIPQVTNSSSQTTCSDKKGRTWTYSISMSKDVMTSQDIIQKEFKVTFLNGDYLWGKQPSMSQNDIDYQIGGWKKHYKNGAVVTVKYDEKKYNANVRLANISFFSHKRNIAELWECEEFMLAPKAFSAISINNIQSNTPSKEVDKQIKEKLLPYMENNGTQSSFEVYASQNKYGVFKNGKCLSTKEEREMQAAAKAAEAERVNNIKEDPVIADAQRLAAGTKYVDHNYKVTRNFAKAKFGNGQMTLVENPNTSTATLEVINFGTKGNTIIMTIEFTEAGKRYVKNFSWSGPDVKLMPFSQDGVQGLIVARNNESTSCGVLAKDTEGKWTVIVNAGDAEQTMSFLKKGMLVKDVQAEWAKGGMGNFKYTHNSGNMKVYTLYGLSTTKRYNPSRTDYKYVARNDAKYGEFYFDAQGKLVKWLLF